MTTTPQPANDEAIAAICRWLKERGLTMHVSLLGGVTLRKKLGVVNGVRIALSETTLQEG